MFGLLLEPIQSPIADRRLNAQKVEQTTQIVLHTSHGVYQSNFRKKEATWVRHGGLTRLDIRRSLLQKEVAASHFIQFDVEGDNRINRQCTVDCFVASVECQFAQSRLVGYHVAKGQLAFGAQTSPEESKFSKV